MKKNYRELLADQINEKYTRNAVDKEIKIKEQEIFKNMTYTPQELAIFARERKLVEMNKYKQDLDSSSSNLASSRERSKIGPTTKNDFNVIQMEDRHNPLVNPVPFNIQNPYILKQMTRKQPAFESSFNSQIYWFSLLAYIIITCLQSWAMITAAS